MPTSGIAHTREVVMQRLGGYFDYAQFNEDLRQIMVEKEVLDRTFKREALEIPELPKNYVAAKYDFSSSIFSKDPFQSQQQTSYAPLPEKMSTMRPAYLDDIRTEPTYKVDMEAFRNESTFGPQKSIVEDIHPI
jgi:hypothetical protein